jgi:nitrite reductase (NADH) small subunit
MTEWIDVGAFDAIAPLTAKVIETARGPVAIFRTQDDLLFAVADRCPHRDGPLSEGTVQGHFVTCPFHHWVINLKTGRAEAPDRGSTACFAVKVEKGQVYLQKDED